jgi:NitT/TauT family transport system ATP-binding protein
VFVTAIEFDRVSRDFVAPDGRVYRAIEDVSIAIPAGAFVALVGPSGCGKSTLLNLAAGLLAPTSGSVRVDGQDLSGLNRRATYMFQQDALLPWKNVRDNVALGLLLTAVSKADAHQRAAEWIDRVGLGGFAGHYPSQLSGGMRKRVALAQNWILDRSQLLMDEPFSALDVHTRQLMETELLALWDTAAGDARGRRESAAPPPDALPRRTILFVTHDLEEAITLADEVIILSAGPATRVVARKAIGLPRPRDLFELRTSDAFLDLYRAISRVLREQVVRSQHMEARPA